MVDLKNIEDPKIQELVDDAIKHPENYVLKPQKEGGGNNYFNEEMREILIKKENIKSFLLMTKIDAPVLQTYMIRKGKLTYTPSITELGIFSFFISNSITGEIILNEVDGLLPRTKQADCNEGGVNAGFAVIDHLLLTDCEVKDLKPSLPDLNL